MFYQTDSSEPVFFNFEDCWHVKLSKSGNYTQSYLDQVENYLQVTKSLENDFSCSGMCNPGLFWFTKDVTKQPPL